MSTCCCSLVGTAACLKCPNRSVTFVAGVMPLETIPAPPSFRNRVLKMVEEGIEARLKKRMNITNPAIPTNYVTYREFESDYRAIERLFIEESLLSDLKRQIEEMK